MNNILLGIEILSVFALILSGLKWMYDGMKANQPKPRELFLSTYLGDYK
jgi:hypothetical protein